MKYLATTAGAVLAIALSSQAGAAVIVLDDFDTGGQFVNQTATMSATGNRTLEIDISGQNSLSFPGNIDPFAQVDPVSPTWGSALILSNGSGDDSEVTLSYDIAADLALADSKSLRLDFLDNDTASGIDNTVEAFLNGSSLGTKVLADSDAPFSVSWALDEIQAAALAAGSNLSFAFNGAPDFDLVLDSVSAVPEPGMLALFGLGLAGIGLSARRRRAA